MIRRRPSEPPAAAGRARPVTGTPAARPTSAASAASGRSAPTACATRRSASSAPTCVAEGAKDAPAAARTAYGGRARATPRLTSMVLIGINVGGLAGDPGHRRLGSALVDRLACAQRRAAPRATATSTTSTRTRLRDAVGGALAARRRRRRLVAAGDQRRSPTWRSGTSAVNMLALCVLGPAAGAGRWAGSASWPSTCSRRWPARSPSCGSPPSPAHPRRLGRDLRPDRRAAVVALKVGGDLRSCSCWLVINVVITVVGRRYISWQGHLGGLLGGALIAALIAYAPAPQAVQWGGLRASRPSALASPCAVVSARLTCGATGLCRRPPVARLDGHSVPAVDNSDGVLHRCGHTCGELTPRAADSTAERSLHAGRKRAPRPLEAPSAVVTRVSGSGLLPLGREAEPDRHEGDADDEVPLAEVVEDRQLEGRRRRRRRCRSTAGR